jgi:hypothetical protein
VVTTSNLFAGITRDKGRANVTQMNYVGRENVKVTLMIREITYGIRE